MTEPLLPCPFCGSPAMTDDIGNGERLLRCSVTRCHVWYCVAKSPAHALEAIIKKLEGKKP